MPEFAAQLCLGCTTIITDLSTYGLKYKKGFTNPCCDANHLHLPSWKRWSACSHTLLLLEVAGQLPAAKFFWDLPQHWRRAFLLPHRLPAALSLTSHTGRYFKDLPRADLFPWKTWSSLSESFAGTVQNKHSTVLPCTLLSRENVCSLKQSVRLTLRVKGLLCANINLQHFHEISLLTVLLLSTQ